jgi:hypothetical protein
MLSFTYSMSGSSSLIGVSKMPYHHCSDIQFSALG